MLKLLNRFAWLISITIGIAIFAINVDFFILALIVIFLVKFLFLSENFIEERLEFFTQSIKRNYLDNEKITKNNDIIDLNKIKKDDTENIVKVETIIDEQVPYNLNEEKIKEKNIDIQNSINYTKYNNQQGIIEIFINNILNYVKDFFSTNILAKLGGILIFLAVVYFLKDFVGELWYIIGPLGRIIFGIIVGFIVYFVGIKLYSSSKNEGLVLMGTGILINFAVILSGRYLIGDGGYLTEGTTFLFLILNTFFGVLTSLIYNSRILLIFSFIFAYLNPFIVGANPTGDPYTLIGYSFIVSLGALYLAFKDTNLTLFVLCFILGNILFLVAPFTDSIGWSSKIILTTIFNIIVIIGTNKFSGINFNSKEAILYLFLGSYFFIILNLLNSHILVNGDYINSYIGILNINLDPTGYITIVVAIFIFLFFSYYYSIKSSLSKLFSIGTIGTILLLSPIIITKVSFSESEAINVLHSNIGTDPH